MGNEEPGVWIQGVKGTQVRPLIESDERVIRVAAGPGTGKTFGLVRRVERILHAKGLGVPGPQILVVAFNRVIAHSLRSDINARLKGTDLEGQGPVVSTVHSLCLKILGHDTRMLMDHERDAMLYDIRQSEPRLVSKYATFDATEQALHDHEAGHEVDDLLGECVEAWLTRHSATLTGDLPKSLLNRLKAGDFNDQKFKHIFADEFQDLTSVEQLLLIKLLAQDGHLVALGDPRQSIYHFRGNEPQGLAKLEELTGAKVFNVDMVENLRNPGRVVKMANRVEVASTAPPMTVGSVADDNTHVVVWATPEDEAVGMAKAICENYMENPDDDHLVMVTRRDFGYALRDEIVKLSPEVQVNLCFSEGLLETWAAREAFLFFCLLNAPDAPSWRAWLGYQTPNENRPYKSPSRNTVAYLKLMDELKDKLNEEELRNYALRPKKQGDGNGAGPLRSRIARYDLLKRRFAALATEPTKLIEVVFEPTQWIEHWMKDKETASNDLRLLQKLAEDLYDQLLVEDPETKIILRQVATQMRSLIATREVAEAKEGKAIQVSTLWSAKGVTAHHVYVIGLCAEAIPGQYQETYRGTEVDYRAEQQRLFYVSITRSKGTLVLSRARKIKAVQAAKLGLIVSPSKYGIADLKACPFMVKIMDELPDAVPGETWMGCKPA